VVRCGAGFFLLLLLLLLSAFALEAGAQTARVQWDREVDFTGYETFAWIDGMAAEDPATDRLVREEIENQLGIRGILPQPADPDLYVAYYASVREEFQIRGGYRSDWEASGTLVVETYVAGTLVIDLVDVLENRVVWRGWATATLTGNPRRDAPRVRAAIERLLAGFPPQP
jgi:hypothetical protein